MRRGWSWHVGLGRELGYVFWAMAGVEAAFGAYSAIWPLWIEALGAPVPIVGLVLGSSGVLRLLALGPSAALAERFEPRTLIMLARTCAGLGMLAAALATHWTQLFAMVVGTAIGEIAFPLTQSYLASHAGERRVRAFTLVFNVGPAAAFGLSPLMAGALVALFGMRAAFVLAAAFTAGSILAFSRFSTRRGDAAPEPPASGYREVLGAPGVRRVLALHFGTIFALSLGVSLLPTFLADQRGFAPAVVAVLGGVGSFGSVLFGLVVARSAAMQRAPFVAAVVAATAVSVTIGVSAVSPLAWPIVLAFVGRGGLFSAWGLFVAAMSEIVRDGPHRARAFALCEMIGGSAFFSAPILAGQLYEIAPVAPLAASLALSAVMIPILLRSQRRLLRVSIAGQAPAVEPEVA